MCHGHSSMGPSEQHILLPSQGNTHTTTSQGYTLTTTFKWVHPHCYPHKGTPALLLHKGTPSLQPSNGYTLPATLTRVHPHYYLHKGTPSLLRYFTRVHPHYYLHKGTPSLLRYFTRVHPHLPSWLYATSRWEKPTVVSPITLDSTWVKDPPSHVFTAIQYRLSHWTPLCWHTDTHNKW